MVSGDYPQVNDDGAGGRLAELTASVFSQLVENYATYLRQIVAHFDNSWQEGLRPELNALIHAMEKEAEVP